MAIKKKKLNLTIHGQQTHLTLISFIVYNHLFERIQEKEGENKKTNAFQLYQDKESLIPICLKNAPNL